MVASLIEQQAGLNFNLTPPVAIREEIVKQLKNAEVPLCFYLTHENKGWINYLDGASKTLTTEGNVQATFHACPLTAITQVIFWPDFIITIFWPCVG